MISVDLGCWNSVFVVPTEVVDKHIKMASGYQLKVLLWVIRNAGKECSEKEIAMSLGIDEVDVKDYMQYWIECGIFKKNENILTATDDKINEPIGTKAFEKNISEDAKEDIKDDKKMPIKKLAIPKVLNQREIAIRIADSPEIDAMLKMCEPLCGVTMSNYASQGRLIALYDYYGLPVDVIIMIVQYAYNKNKCNLHYIESIAADWAENEINTHEKAEARIIAMDKGEKATQMVVKAFGLQLPKVTKEISKYASVWVEQWGFDEKMLTIAYERCINATSNFSMPYINKILQRWKEEGIKTPEQITDRKDTNNLKNSFKKEDSSASYDIDLFDKLMLEGKF